MSDYQNILVSLDLSDDAEVVCRRAADVARRYNAKVTFAHVVEPLITDANYVLPVMSNEIETVMVQRAENFLAGLSKKFPQAKAKVVVKIGAVKHEIFRIIEDQSIDLIIMGTHGRHGVARLLGSTASAILHGTPIDVLCVRVGKAD